jgi:hypothetical protein
MPAAQVICLLALFIPLFVAWFAQERSWDDQLAAEPALVDDNRPR